MATPAGAAAAAQPKSGGTLRAVKTGDIAPIDPHYHSPSNGLGAWILYDTLTGYDDNLKPVPFLAESWDQSADQRTMKLFLAQGRDVPHGRDLTADDIIYNLNRLSDPKANTAGIIPRFRAARHHLAGSRQIHRGYHAPAAVGQHFRLHAGVQHRRPGHARRSGREEHRHRTGPFSMAEWVPGDHVLYAKNKNYWQPGPAVPGCDPTRDRQRPHCANGAVRIARP